MNSPSSWKRKSPKMCGNCCAQAPDYESGGLSDASEDISSSAKKSQGVNLSQLLYILHKHNLAKEGETLKRGDINNAKL